MSAEALNQVCERAMTDSAFRDQLINDPDTALGAYDLTADERAALLSGDPVRLDELGVDERLTKRAGGPGTDVMLCRTIIQLNFPQR